MSELVKNWKRIWRQLLRRRLFSLLAIALISACSGIAIDQNSPRSSEMPTSDCRIVQHEMGEACVPNTLERIVTIPFMLLGNALALGAEPIGSTLPYEAETELTQPYLNMQTYLGNKTAGISNIGATHTPTIEKILTLEPDLILDWNRSSLEQIYPRLSQIAPTVVIPFEFSNHWEHFDFMAETLGKQETAQQVRDDYYQRVEELKTALGDRYQNQEISMIGAFGPNNLFAYAQNSFPSSILADVGLNRPAAQREMTSDGVIRNISQESLETVEGDILLFMLFGQENKKR